MQSHSETPFHNYPHGYNQNDGRLEVLTRMWRDWTLIRCGYECKMYLPWKIVWWFVKKLNRFATQLSNSTPRYIFKRTEKRCPNKNLHNNVYSSITHNSQKIVTTQRSTNWLTDKQNGAHSYNGILFDLKKGIKYWSMLQHRWILKTC